MAVVNEHIEAVKDWLANEVKLERYADKLVSNGYISLEICCNIDENALDKIGIVLPYHRRRFLGFVEKLRDKLGMNLTNEDNGVISNTELISNGAEEGSEQEKSLIIFDSVDEDKDVDDTNSVYANVDVPRLPPKRSSGKARPPPIPPRRDLEEGTSADKTVHPDTQAQGLEQQSHCAEPSSGETVQSETPSQGFIHQSYSAQPSSGETVQSDTQVLDLVQKSHFAEPSVPMDVPKKKAPVKPPRRAIKAASESKPGATPSISPQISTGNNAQEPVAASVSSDAVGIFDPLKAEETPADVNSTSSFPGLPKPLTDDVFSKPSEKPAVLEDAIYGNIEDTASHSTTTARPAPKLPTRAGSKKPVPAPRVRGKSEDETLVTALVPNGSTANDDKEESPPVLNHSLQPRTKSFSTPGNRKVSSEDKPSTLPRYPAVKRVAPPPPPSRQSSASLKDNKGFPNMPLPPIPPIERSVKKQLDEVDGDRHQGMVLLNNNLCRTNCDQKCNHLTRVFNLVRAREKLEFQLNLWTSSSQILLALGKS